MKTLNIARRFIARNKVGSANDDKLVSEFTNQDASNLIYDCLMSDAPKMIGRLGHSEFKVLSRYSMQKDNSFLVNAMSYVSGLHGPFWFDDATKTEIENYSGVFPNDNSVLKRFSERYFRDMAELDVIGGWIPGEQKLAKYFPSAKVIDLADVEPYYHDIPWSRALKGKRVLVVHPFDVSIKEQYKKRELLYESQDILPEFELITLKAVQSSRGNDTQFDNWFDALDSMCDRISNIEFDIAIVGAGAYGLPLAAHIKRLGKHAVHLGGATQIMFGIRGDRWEKRDFFRNLMNQHWVRPSADETPGRFVGVDNKLSSYW